MIVTTLAFTGFAAAIALAILKYRLYDIDRLINRTLVYGLLTTLLAGIYALAVLAWIHRSANAIADFLTRPRVRLAGARVV